ncbi:hypothetical protein ACFDTO_10015 [Microbacteriaceae bacterium 4G12]
MTTTIALPRILAVAAATLLAAAALTPAPAAVAVGNDPYFSVPFSSDLYVLDQGVAPNAIPSVRIATLEEWGGDGYPVPVATRARYKAYEWSARIYAEISFNDFVYAQHLTPDQWRRAGAPVPTRNTLIVGTVLVKYDTADDLIVVNPREELGASPRHTLDFAEWRRLGFPRPTALPNQGYQKLSWSPVITEMRDLWSGVGAPIRFEDWAALGFPRPQVIPRYPRDLFCATPLSPDILYVGPAYPEGIILTYEQWRAAGSPTPKLFC